MIVDMVRNDMGRIARTGSVRVPALFQVEKYRTVWQMTSTVECQTPAGLTDIFTALFPAASIAARPKRAPCKSSANAEATPPHLHRHAGLCRPGRQAQFNVAIRTFWLEKRAGTVEYGLGGGIVWDSEARDELREAYHKAQILTAPPPPLPQLLETLLWTPETGFALLERHLARMRESAAYFDFPFEEETIRRTLDALVPELAATAAPVQVRILLDSAGRLRPNTPRSLRCPRPTARVPGRKSHRARRPVSVPQNHPPRRVRSSAPGRLR